MKEGRLGAGWFLPVALTLLVVDQATKFMVEQKFRIGLELPILPGYFSITRVHNTGVAFGLGQGNNLVTGILAVGILVVATWVVRDWDWQKRWIQWVTGLVAGGAVGNLVDRVRLGYVLDFLDFHYGGWSWPAFNVADAAISVGVGLVVWSWLMGKTPEKRGGSGRAD